MDPFYIWCQKIGRIAKHKYDMDINDYTPKYDMQKAFEDGVRPGAFVEGLAKNELGI